MLHAFARNKSKAYVRYLRVREPHEPRVSSEDEITSIVFGALDFLSAADNWRLWTLLLENHASNTRSGPLPHDFLRDFSPHECVFEFWPRKDNIEPDLVVTFSNAEGATRSLLIELKWDASFSGADQLEKQWLRYQNGKHANSLHVFIAKDMGKIPSDRTLWSAPEEDGEDASHLRAIRWHELKHEIEKLARLPDVSAPLRRWCMLTGGFLSRLGIRAFVGFHTTVQLSDALGDEQELLEFWQRAVTRPAI